MRGMTDISERYGRLAADFAATIAAVPADRWGDPSPCPDWDARDVVRHVVESHATFEGLVDRTLEPGPEVDDDPAGAFAAATAQVQAELEDPARADVEFDGFFGRSTFAQAIDRFISGDLLVHRWDLARATGSDETMPADEVEGALAALLQMGDAIRGAGVFAAAIEPPEGADPQTKLLCFVGRQP